MLKKTINLSIFYSTMKLEVVKIKIVVAHGTFDIIHYGHINYLEKAKSFGDYLIVLVTSDKLAQEFNKKPFFDENVRLKMILSLKCVDKAILRTEHFSKEMLEKLGIDVFVTTDKKFDQKNNICISNKYKIKVVDRTEDISSTIIKKYLAGN